MKQKTREHFWFSVPFNLMYVGSQNHLFCGWNSAGDLQKKENMNQTESALSCIPGWLTNSSTATVVLSLLTFGY